MIIACMAKPQMRPRAKVCEQFPSLCVQRLDRSFQFLHLLLLVAFLDHERVPGLPRLPGVIGPPLSFVDAAGDRLGTRRRGRPVTRNASVPVG